MIIIQISEQYLKIILARHSGSGMQIVASFVEEIISFGDIQITGKIQEALKKFKVRPRCVVLSLARNLTTVRNLHLPSQNKEEVAQMVDLNVIRVVPYKKEDIVFGYRTAGLDEMGYTRAVTAIVKIDAIRRLVKIIEQAGLSIEKIVLGSYGVWKKVKTDTHIGAASQELCLLLELDADFTDFIIFSADHLYFTRSINIGARALAERSASDGDKFISEIQQSLMMFYNEEINKKPSKIVLCGARAGQKLVSRIELALGVPVLVVDHSQGVPDNVSVSSLSGFDHVNENEVEFILPEMQVRKTLHQTTRDLVILGSLCLYILTMVCGLYWGRSYNQEAYLSRLRQASVRTEKELGDLPIKQKKAGVIKAYLADRASSLFIFSELQKVIPSRVAVISVTVDEKQRVALRGQAAELSDVFKLIDNLDQAGHFEGVQTKSTRKKQVKDRGLIEFELSFSLKQAL